MDEIDYSQPHFYHFSEDSLHLAKFIIEKEKYISHLLDLCAGSGVIGIEVANGVDYISKLSFVEIQNDFLPHIEWNLKNKLIKDIPCEIIQNSLSNVVVEKVDIIAANPPYFKKNSSRLSPNLKKAIARHFVEDTQEDFFKFLERNLSPQGRAYFIVPLNWEKEIIRFGGKIEKELSHVKIYSWSPSGLKR